MSATRALLAALRDPLPGDDVSDADLLRRFADGRDPAVLDALVRRHARLVWGVCRRTLGPGPDAEDAFQATFLVLARRPDRAGQFGTAAGFLFGVARRVSLKARARADRPPRPSAVPRVLAADPAAVAALHELQTILDEEIERLPAKYRLPFVLCVLEGKPRARAAADLGLNPGTLSARLARARLRLRDRLAKRGVTLAAALAVTDLSATVVPPALTTTTIAAATQAAPAVGANVLFLASEGWWTVKAKLLAASAMAALVGVGGVIGWADGPPVGPPVAKADPPKPAAATKPAEPEAKLVFPPKARLVRTVPLHGPTGQPVWSRDGTLIAVPQQDGVLVVRADGQLPPVVRRRGTLQQDGALVVRAAGGDDYIPLGSNTGFTDPPTKPGEILGFSPDGKTLFTRLDAGRRVNAENKVLFWNTSAASTKPAGELIYDPDDGKPVAILPDGKQALCRSAEGLRLLDLSTGQPGRVVLAEPDLREVAVTPDGRFAVTLKDRPPVAARGAGPPDEVQADVAGWDLATGVRKWTRELKNRRASDDIRLNGYPVLVSPDGRRVAVTLMHGVDVVSSQGSVRSGHPVTSLFVLDGTTGNDVATMTKAKMADGLSLSADGRLLAGTTGASGGHLVVWDAATGKLLKQWPGFAYAAFAPDRPVLATAEWHREGVDTKGNEVHTSSLGLWDLSGLGK